MPCRSVFPVSIHPWCATRNIAVNMVPIQTMIWLIFVTTLQLFGSYALKRHRRKPLQNVRRNPSVIVPENFQDAIANLACHFIEQPLNHFALPRDSVPTYLQRYCVSDAYVVDPENATVFLYTGNESPLEEYINNTGLMWEMAEVLQAQVIFIEHRYEGQSLPDPDIENCMAYSSSIQAIADYANFVETRISSTESGYIQRRPVIAFGGSYGGMLAAWIRMKYPHLVSGAIAGSAPIWGFPRTNPLNIDGAFRVIKHGLDQRYPPTEKPVRSNHCASNLLASWPLIHYLGYSGREGRALLTEAFRLCNPLTQYDVENLVAWAHSPWFDFAEGSFPYPSNYIPFALTHNENATLPPWPLQAACWRYSELFSDLGVRIDGDPTEVRFNVSYGDFAINVDWANWTASHHPLSDSDRNIIMTLLANVRDAVSIWYNISQDLVCYNLDPAPNALSIERQLQQKNATEDCRWTIAHTNSWPALNCNEDMNLVITEAQGLGGDFLWPPSHPRGTRTHVDVIRVDPVSIPEECRDPQGHYGYPQDLPDPWATRYDTFYGGRNIESYSNIIFSNGLLDPWSTAGVYFSDPTNGDEIEHGLRLQRKGNDLVSLILDYGGHHTDLMFSSHKDHSSFRTARAIEKDYIVRWIEAWRHNQRSIFEK